ncbi:aspartate aminotransferase family protein, partial [Azospirillum sp.]|uniref:aspartate aminotransferase family protein n=1 Tax=Azospirillum sp. TaxID=34012 RepID=UPI002D26EA7D
MSNQSLHARRDAAVPRGISAMLPVYIERAENAEMWDVEGRRFIDFAGGIAVLNTGHRHPKVVEAVKKQLDSFTHTCVMVTPYESFVALAERLNAATPGSHPKKTAFFTTGAEAVENAVKVARAHTGRPAVVAFSGAFHGRTMMAMALTGKVAPYKTGFGPFPGDVYHVPFPNAYRGITVEDSLKALDTLFKCDVEPARVAAIFIEPVQGEGGFNIAPPELLQKLRALCDQHGILLVVDEIQTGFARTGKMFAIEHSGVVPDLMTMAKSLAGGFPLSALTGKAEI